MSEKDPFADVVLHDSRIDWSRTDLSADVISAEFIGGVPYWDEPEFKGMQPHEIERHILYVAGRDSWGKRSFWKPYYQHMLTLIKLLFPNTDITPSLADATMLFCMSFGKKKIVNLIGSQNSGKSAASCRLMFACMFIDPEYTVGYVANPFDNAADSTVWGDVEELWDELVDTFPMPRGDQKEAAPAIFPKGKKYANSRLEFVPGIPKAGSIELRNVKHVGKYKGSKQRGKDTSRGVFFLNIDEVNEIDNMAFLTTLTNISSQPGFICMTSQNFKNEDDMGGRLTTPQPLYGGPETFDDLDIDRDLFWHSQNSSITLRFDGHRSPNILSGKTLYPKLFKIEDRDRMVRDYSEQSPIYFSQVRSFPVRGDDVKSVLSKQKISASRHPDVFFTIKDVKSRFAFCDPAFGGRDKAMFGWASYCRATVTDTEGGQEDQDLLVFSDPFKSLRLFNDAHYNESWFNRMRACGMSVADFTPNALVSFEDQIALQCREECLRHNIPFNNFGFDFSMRPDIVSSVNKILGFGAIAFDYNQPPEGAYLQSLKMDSSDCCKNRCTELMFLTADYFLTKQIRGGNHIETAIMQLSRTQYETKNGKYVGEGKKEYKARWQQVSPDHRDVLMGIVGVVNKRGFRQVLQSQAKTSSIWDEIHRSGMGKSRIAKRV
jgi:hypothetical protein